MKYAKRKILFTLSAFSASCFAQNPNIVVFMVDDMGWQDTSAPLPYTRLISKSNHHE